VVGCFNVSMGLGYKECTVLDDRVLGKLFYLVRISGVKLFQSCRAIKNKSTERSRHAARGCLAGACTLNVLNTLIHDGYRRAPRAVRSARYMEQGTFQTTRCSTVHLSNMSDADSASQAAERGNPSDDLNLKMLVCKIKIPHVAHNGMYISSVRTPRANRVQRGQSQGDFPQLCAFFFSC